MWMEERTGERININRTAEAVGTGADQIAVGCPFCRVMLSDGLTMLQSKGEAREEVEILDVAQMLLASVQRAPSSDATETGDESADDSQYPLTVAHDGTEDPEEADEADEADAADEADEADAQPVPSPASSDRGSVIAHSRSDEAVVISIELPAGQPTVARAWSGQDVESILEGDEVDISEFKTKLKAELKAEVLAELKAELEGALNSDSGVSEPVTATSVESTSSAPAAPEVSTEPEAAAASAEPAVETPAETPAEPAAETPAEPPAESAAEPAAAAPAETEPKKDDGGDPPPLLIGSL
jgi:hypothetical protein